MVFDINGGDGQLRPIPAMVWEKAGKGGGLDYVLE